MSQTRLKDKVALVTGGAQDIGREIARIFAREGALVVMADIDDKAGQLAANEIPGNTIFWHLDVSSEYDWQTAFSQISARFGGIDILVNNANIIGDLSQQNPEHCSLGVWHHIQRINLDGVFLGCKEAIIHMKNKPGAAIVNIGSYSGKVGVAHACAYAASKAAIINHTKSVALYCAEKNYDIRCNVVLPGAIVTSLWTPKLKNDKDLKPQLQSLAKTVPLKRMGSPVDVAEAVLYLVTPEARYVTGSELSVDGGLSAH